MRVVRCVRACKLPVAWRHAVSAQADAPGPGAYETLGLDLADTANAFSFAKSVRYSAAGAHPHGYWRTAAQCHGVLRQPDGPL